MSDRSPTSNVNVTLADSPPAAPGRTFPCPLCGSALELRRSRADKPYSICNPCGIQIFFRGKTGISRLRAFVDRAQSVAAPIAPAAGVRLLANYRSESRRPGRPCSVRKTLAIRASESPIYRGQIERRFGVRKTSVSRTRKGDGSWFQPSLSRAS